MTINQIAVDLDVKLCLQVWDREILLQALHDYYDKDVELLLQDIQGNITDVSINYVPDLQIVLTKRVTIH